MRPSFALLMDCVASSKDPMIWLGDRAMPSTPWAQASAELARTGSETVTELIATNEDRLLHHPRIIELLYLNKRTRMSTADRLIDLAVRNGLTLTGIPAFKEAAAALQAVRKSGDDDAIKAAKANPIDFAASIAEAEASMKMAAEAKSMIRRAIERRAMYFDFSSN